MVEIGMLDLGGGALSDGEQFLDCGFVAPVLETFVTLPQRFGDGTGYGLAGGLCNCLRKIPGIGTRGMVWYVTAAKMLVGDGSGGVL